MELFVLFNMQATQMKEKTWVFFRSDDILQQIEQHFVNQNASVRCTSSNNYALDRTGLI